MQIIKTSITRPPRMLIYGEQGIGKSTIGKEMPSPIFLQTSDGLEGLGVDAFPLPTLLGELQESIDWLKTGAHSYKTLVIDTLGGLERLVFADCCAELGLQYMTQASMKSYPLATKKIIKIMGDLNYLNKEKKMFILLIGHSSIMRFEDPTTSSYDRYTLAMNEKIAAYFLQEVDIVGFVNQKISIKTEDAGFSETTKATGSTRYIYFEKQPAFYAKDHDYGLPKEVRLEKGKSWSAIWEHIKTKIGEQKAGNLKQIADEQKEKRAEKEAAVTN